MKGRISFLLISGVFCLAGIGFGEATNVVGTAFSQTLFDGVHVIDVRASTQAWVDSLGKKHDIGRGSPVQLYDQIEALDRAMGDELFEVGILSSLDVLQCENRNLLEPAFVPGNGGQVLQSMLLLVRRDSGIQSLADLRGKSILYPINRYSSVADMWINCALMEQGLASSREDFFKEIRTHRKMSCVVLPVFFGKCDACCVSQRGYELITELNPQVGKDLMVLDMSPPYLASLVYLRKKCDPELKRKLGNAVMQLHETVDGAQVLMSFHLERYEIYQEGLLDNTEALLARYQQLKAEQHEEE
jgi:ABC-type phosphate/phosphonate transport system substrate-binding protein